MEELAEMVSGLHREMLDDEENKAKGPPNWQHRRTQNLVSSRTCGFAAFIGTMKDPWNGPWQMAGKSH
jgi:hypothetical protein